MDEQVGRLTANRGARGWWVAAFMFAVTVVVGGGFVLQHSSGASDAAVTAEDERDSWAGGVALRIAPAVPDSGYEPAVSQTGRGMELLESLPREVESFSLSSVSSALLPGALEAYRGSYVRSGPVADSRADVVLTVGRWSTEADAARQLERVEREFEDAPAVERVSADSFLPVGSQLQAVAFRDGDVLTVVWSDFTTAGSVRGDVRDVRAVFRDFRLGPSTDAASQ